MSEASEPEWLSGWKGKRVPGSGAPIPPAPAPATIDPTRQGPDGRWLKGVSGNSKGRKPGNLDTRQKLQNAFADEALDVAQTVVAKALEGDMSAANIVLSRLLPPLRQQTERVQFELNPFGPLADQANQILAAVAQGLVDPETGKTLIGAIQSVASIRAVEELETRILSLESRTIG